MFSIRSYAMSARLALATLLLAAALEPAAARADRPPGPDPYPAQIGTWPVPNGGAGTGLGWSLAIDRVRHTLFLGEIIVVARGGGHGGDGDHADGGGGDGAGHGHGHGGETIVRVRAFSPTGDLLGGVDLPATADPHRAARPLIAVDGASGVLDVLMSDPLDAGPSATLARLSTTPVDDGAGHMTLVSPAAGPATLDIALPDGPVELKDLAVDPASHELLLLGRTAEADSLANGGQFLWRLDSSSGARTAVVMTDPLGVTGGPGRTRVAAFGDGSVDLLSQPFGTGAPAGIWRFAPGTHDATPSPIPTYASRNVTNPAAPPPGFGVGPRDPLDELSPGLALDDAGRLLAPFAPPVAPPPGQPVPQRIDTAIAVLDPGATGTLGDPAFPGASFLPAVQLIAGDAVRRDALPFFAGNYACHLGEARQTGAYEQVVDREQLPGQPGPSDVLYVLTKRSRFHRDALVMRIGPRLPGSFSCWGPPAARLDGVPRHAVPAGTTVQLDASRSLDPNVGDRFLEPIGIFRVEWDLTSDQFAPGDTIVKKQVPLGHPPDATLDLTVNQSQFVALRVWNAAGLKSDVLSAWIRVGRVLHCNRRHPHHRRVRCHWHGGG